MRQMSSPMMEATAVCARCGKKFLNQGYEKENLYTLIMDRDKVCFDCAFWYQTAIHPPKDMEVTAERCLIVHPVIENPDNSMLLGGKGRMRYFVLPDKSIIMSNDVWTIGKIPQKYKHLFPQTLTEISTKSYNRIMKDGSVCKARGCFDRYTCYRYNMDLDLKDGKPFNIVPPYWREGCEKCQFYISMTEMDRLEILKHTIVT